MKLVNHISAIATIILVTNSIVCRFFPHCSVILWHQLSILQLSSMLPYVLGDSITSHRLTVQTYKSAPHPELQTPIVSPSCHLCFWLTCSRLETPITHSLGLTNFLELLTELRGTFYLLRLSVYYKKIQQNRQEQPDRRDSEGQGKRKGCRASMPSPSHTLAEPPLHSPTWKLSEPPLPFIKWTWLIKSLTTFDWTQSLVPLHLCGGGE